MDLNEDVGEVVVEFSRGGVRVEGVGGVRAFGEEEGGNVNKRRTR